MPDTECLQSYYLITESVQQNSLWHCRCRARVKFASLASRSECSDCCVFLPRWANANKMVEVNRGDDGYISNNCSLSTCKQWCMLDVRRESTPLPICSAAMSTPIGRAPAAPHTTRETRALHVLYIDGVAQIDRLSWQHPLVSMIIV